MLAALLAGVRCARPHEQSKSSGFATAHPAVARHPARRAAAEIVPDPPRALARARELAGRDGVVIATGSLYLIADLLAPARARAGFGPVNDPDDQPSFLTMIGLVALIVAIVILVFFGIGYLFGRAFL